MLRRSRQEHLNNIALAFLNVAVLATAGLLIEYEVAKAARPDLAWPATPSGIVWAVAGVTGLGSLAVLSILALIYKKGLYNRPYLWWMTGFTMIIGAGTFLLLAQGIGIWALVHFVLFP